MVVVVVVVVICAVSLIVVEAISKYSGLPCHGNSCMLMTWQ